MGYVHDALFSVLTALEEIKATVGTWTINVSSHLWTFDHSAAADTSVLHVPLRLQQNSAGNRGALLKSVDIFWVNATADLNDITAAIYDATLPASGGTLTTAALTFTYDAAHNSTALRKTQAVHQMTLTITTPAWVLPTDDICVELTVNAATTSAFKLYGVRANYTLRA